MSKWSNLVVCSLLEMAPSAHLSPGGFYVAFGCADLECGCDPTESVPRGFDCLGSVVWCRAGAYARINCPICPTFYTGIWANL